MVYSEQCASRILHYNSIQHCVQCTILISCGEVHPVKCTVNSGCHFLSTGHRTVGAPAPQGEEKHFRRNLQGKLVSAPSGRARVNFRTFLLGWGDLESSTFLKKKVHPQKKILATLMALETPLDTTYNTTCAKHAAVSWSVAVTMQLLISSTFG